MKITRRQLRQIIKEELSADADGDGIPDDQEDTMDPDQKVSMILNKIRDLLEEAHKIAEAAPDHQDKGEGFAMAELEQVVNDIHQTYGTEYWQGGISQYDPGDDDPYGAMDARRGY